MKKSKLLYLLYLTRGLIIAIIIIIIRRYETVALINRETNFNSITTLLVTRIKGFLETEYNLDLKNGIIE